MDYAKLLTVISQIQQHLDSLEKEVREDMEKNCQDYENPGELYGICLSDEEFACVKQVWLEENSKIKVVKTIKGINQEWSLYDIVKYFDVVFRFQKGEWINQGT